MKISNWLLLVGVLLLSCTKEAEIFPLGQDYFPVVIGDYRIYDVTETNYIDKVETIESYQLKESFYDSIVNGSETTYLMRVEQRDTDQDSWVSIESISIRQTNAYLHYQEQNSIYVKMSYPVQTSREWDGNAQNTDSQQLYHYENLGINDYTFENPDHIKVIISELPANIVEQDERYETYAQGIGLVERSYIKITFCQAGCTDINEKENGQILVQRLIEYGSE